MSVSQRDKVMLWGRAAERCAACRQKLTQNELVTSQGFIVGEQAHIVAASPDGPRGVSPLSSAQRDSYDNLILLCPSCHVRVDAAPRDYPVEVLHAMKTAHENWVLESLANLEAPRDRAATVIYARLIDLCSDRCDLGNARDWMSKALRYCPVWSDAAGKKISFLHDASLGAAWPRILPELEAAMRWLAHRISQTYGNFAARATAGYLESQLIVQPRYSLFEKRAIKDQRIQEHNDWYGRHRASMLDLIKTANWFADVVRSEINPMFFAMEGKFIVDEPAAQGDGSVTALYEYTGGERAYFVAQLSSEDCGPNPST